MTRDRVAGFLVGAGVALIVASGVGAFADDPPPPAPPPTTTSSTTTSTSTPGVRFRAPGGGCVETSPTEAARVGAVNDPACERNEEGE